MAYLAILDISYFMKNRKFSLKTLQELRMLSSVPINCQETKICHESRFLTLLNAGVWRLNLGRGGRNPPPHLFEVLLVPWTQKMVPNPKTRRD